VTRTLASVQCSHGVQTQTCTWWAESLPLAPFLFLPATVGRQQQHTHCISNTSQTLVGDEGLSWASPSMLTCFPAAGHPSSWATGHAPAPATNTHTFSPGEHFIAVADTFAHKEKIMGTPFSSRSPLPPFFQQWTSSRCLQWMDRRHFAGRGGTGRHFFSSLSPITHRLPASPAASAARTLAAAAATSS